MIVLDHPRQATSAVNKSLRPDLVMTPQKTLTLSNSLKATAVARAFPIYSAKSSSSSSSDNEISTSFSSSSTERTVYVEFILPPEFSEFECIDYPHLQLVANGVQTASRLVDMPASELNTTTYLAEIQRMHDEKLKSLGVQIEVIKGNELRDRGFGGLWGVGKVKVKRVLMLEIVHYQAILP